MIQIVKRGRIEMSKRKFTCSNCGTVFVADRDDYDVEDDQGQGILLGAPLASCVCPLCLRRCFASYPYGPSKKTPEWPKNKQIYDSLELGAEQTEGAE